MFEHDESLGVDLLLIKFPASYENGKLEHFLHQWRKNCEPYSLKKDTIEKRLASGYIDKSIYGSI